MPTIAELGFAVHSEPIDQAAESLDNLVDAGARAEKAVDGLAGASDKAGKTVSTSAREAAAAVEKQAEASKKAGDATGQFTDGLDRVGVSAKQTAAALRLVPAQLTDIVVGLQGGQAPLTVLLQQGGQLKDMFGGIGPAAKALGGYIVGLVNPLTVATAATAALGAAYYSGWKESDNFNKALILTGNSAGTSAGQLSFLAQSIGATVGTAGAAADALAMLASSGKIASENFGLITEAALELKENTGRAVEETVAEFAKIADDPVAAAKTLNEQYHFLTQSTYSQIAALKEQGDTSEATKLLTEAYADAIKNRSGEMTQNLGYVERAWRGIKDATLGAIDAAKNIGRPDSLEGQRATAQEKLNDLETKSQNILVSRSASVKRERLELQNQLYILDLQIDVEKKRTATQAEQAKIHQDAITATQKVDAIVKSTYDNETKRNEEIKQYKRLLEDIRKDNPDDKRLLQSNVDKAIQNIKDKYKDAKVTAPAVDLTSFNDAQNALKNLDVAFQNSVRILDASQKAGLISTEQYASQKSALISKEKTDVEAAYQAEITALEGIRAKSTTSGAQRIQIDQKIADARAHMVDALKKLDTDQQVLSTEMQGRLKKDEAAIKAFAQTVQDSLNLAQQGLDNQVAGYGLSERSRQQLQEDLKIRQDYQKQLEKLTRDYNNIVNPTSSDKDRYDRETKILDDALETRLGMQSDYYRKEDALRSDWMNGASRAFANYIDETKDVAGQTEGLFSDALHGVEDAFVNAATTGKLSFKDLADSIIADLARIVAKAYIVTPILAALGIGGDPASGAGSAGGLGSLLGGGTGGGLGGTLSNISTVVSAAGSKFGQSLLSGWNGGEGVVGGLEGAFSNGADYFKSVVTSAFETGSTTAASIFTSETTSAALSQGYSNYAAQFGTGVAGQGAFDGALGSAAAQSSALSGLQTLSATLGYIQGVYTIFSSFKDYGLKGGAVTAGAGAAGAYIGSFAGPLGTAAGFAIGTVLGSLGAGKLFGGSGEKYPDLSTSAQGTYKGGQYNTQGIVQGWQTNAPKFGTSVDAQLDSTVNKFAKTLGDLYTAFGASTQVYAYDMLQVRKTSGKYSTTFGATIDGGGANDLNIHQQFTAADAAEALQHNYDDIMGTFLAKAIVSSKSLPDYFRAQFTEFANDWDTTADQVIKAIEGIFTRFNGVNDALSLIGVNNLKLDDTGLAASDSILNMIGAMNGLDTATASAKDKVDSLNKAVSTYYQAFFSADEQFADLTKSLKNAFAGFGLELPDTRSAYRDMVEDIDVTTAAGQAMFATLVGLATNADSYYSTLDQKAKDAQKAAADAQQAAADAAQKIIDGLMGNVTSAESAVERAINAQKASINDMLQTANTSVSDLTGVSNDLGSALKSLRGESGSAVQMLRAQAQATLQSALAQARAGKSLAGFTGLSDALDTISNNSTDLYSSLEDFNRDQGRTANVVSELEKLNGKQLTSAEQTVKTLQSQLDALDDQLEFAQAQLDALNGVDNSVKTVEQAIREMNAAVVAALGGQVKGSAQTNTQQNNETLVNSIYKQYLGRDADAPGLAAWTGALANGASYQEVLAAIKASAAANGQLAGHATGGYISGPGTGTSDSILARLSNGEYVMKAAAVSTYGTDLLDRMNNLQMPKFASGGSVMNVASPVIAANPQSNRAGSDAGDSAEVIRQLNKRLSNIETYMDSASRDLRQLNNAGVQIVGTVSTKEVAA